MADIQLQTLLNSGNISGMNIGGTASGDRVTTVDDLTPIADRVTALENPVVSYGAWTDEPNLALTNVFQKVTGFIPMTTPVNITESNGTFTAGVAGVYTWFLERIYVNGDTNPTPPITLTLEVRRNGIPEFTRTAIISAATAGDEPSTATFSTPFIQTVAEDDYFEFYVKAEEGTGSPSDTVLTRMQLTAHKIN